MDDTAGKEESVVGVGEKASELARKLLSQGRLYDKEFENWTVECKRVTRRYRSERGRGLTVEEDSQAWFNLFWASLQTALPSLYARTPVPQVDRRYKDSDPVARVASEILERAVRFELKNHDFDGTASASVLDRLLYARGLARIYYEPTIEVVDGVEVKTKETVRAGYVQLPDFKHSLARTWDEVTQMRFRSYLSKEEATKRFGADKAKKLAYTQLPEVMDDDRNFNEGEQDDYKKAEVWEVWDKPTRTVIWISSELSDDVLDMLPDPLNLEGFFPMPKPLYGTLTNDSLIPVPDARQCKRLYNLLDDISAKIGALTEDLRVAGFYDAQLEDIPRLVRGGDRLIAVRNFAALKAQGGLESAIEFWPVDYVVNALDVLYRQKEETKNDIYEVTGWADIMRGATDPNETAAAQQLKGRFASIRLTNAQNDVQRFCRDLIALMGEVIAEQFEPNQLMAMTGMEFVPGQSPEEQQQNYLMAVQLLRSEPMRRFRIDIETDSTLAINEALDQAARSDFMQSLVGALQQIGPLFEQMPAFVPVLGEAINFVARTYKAGRTLEGAIEQAVEQSKAMIAQQGEQPPPPDPKIMEVQGKLEIAKVELQAKIQQAETEAQDRAARNQLEMQTQQLKAQRDQIETQIAIQDQQLKEILEKQRLVLAEQELQIKAQAVQVDMLKVQTMAQSESDKAAIKAESSQMQHLIEMQKLELDQMRVRLSESEKLMEERRLAAEQQLERIRLNMEQLQTTGVSAAKSGEKPIVINNIIPKASRKIGTIGTDALGQTTLQIDNVDD